MDKEENLDIYKEAEQSANVRKRVEAARERQLKRFINSSIKTNGEMSSSQIKKYCQFAPQTIDFLKQAISRLSLSARSYFKIIKVAQTIADLNKNDRIEAVYVSEALQYRLKEE